MKQGCLTLSWVQCVSVEKYRDEMETVGCQRQALPMSAGSDTSGTHGRKSGKMWQMIDYCIERSRDFSTGEGIFISLILQLKMAPKWHSGCFFPSSSNTMTSESKRTPTWNRELKPGGWGESNQLGHILWMFTLNPFITTNSEPTPRFLRSDWSLYM